MEEQTINIKQDSGHSKMNFWSILGIILAVLFIVSLIIDIREDGLRCIKLKDCKPLGTAVLTKIFLVDYHISSEIDYLKENNVVTTEINSSTIVPDRAVRTDLFVNIAFYLVLLILIVYISYLIGKRGFTGTLSAILGLAIYFTLLIVITAMLTKQIYIPLSCFGKLFNYIGAII